VAALGEFDLIRRFFERPGRAGTAVLGVGDDCALLAPAAGALAVSTDMLVAGRHFFPDVDPESLGHKALAVNLSDLAAMGARPLGFTLALALPEVDEAWLEGFARGLFALADASGCELVGGDTTRGPLNLCITVFGEVPPAEALRRDRARVGDDIWVSGTLGAAAWAVADRSEGLVPADAGHRAQAIACLERPQPRLALGQALKGLAGAAIDLSDGLAGDLQHILDRSAGTGPGPLGARLEWPRIPCHPVLDAVSDERRRALALAGGDDYELLFCAPVSAREPIMALSARLGLALSRIGRIEPIAGLRLLDANGLELAFDARSFDHFR
jgi:thiamine-monophosphate kinase